MKILIIGGNGQLGKTLLSLAPLKIGDDSVEIISVNRKDLDLCDLKACKKLVLQIKPDFLINAAAYTFVDLAEKDSDISFLVNALAPMAFAEAIKETSGKFIHFSTDYVFDGNSANPYQTFDLKKPLNIYGQSKSEGENYILKILNNSKQCHIIRTSWLISQYGDNFLIK